MLGHFLPVFRMKRVNQQQLKFADLDIWVILVCVFIIVFCALMMMSAVIYRAYPGSEFVVANTLAKWKKLEQIKLTLAKVLARK